MKLFRNEQTVFERTVDGVPIQVVDRGDQRELRFGNHITQSARALSAPDVLLLDYTRGMMAGLLFLPKPGRVLHVGLGGGSLPTFLHRHLPDVRQRIVEVNPGVIDVAFRYFALPISPRLEVLEADGLEFLRQDTGRYGLIMLDAFHANGAAPHMNSGSVFRMLRQRLEPGGWLVVNTWGSHPERLAHVRESLGEAFARLYYLSVRADSNVIFIACGQPRDPTAAQLRRRAQWLSQQFPLDFAGLLRQVRPAFTTPGHAPALSGTGG